MRALRCLGVIDLTTLAAMLDDPSAAVTRQVVTTLQLIARDISIDRLSASLAADNPHHVRTTGYRMLRARDVWTRLLTDLELYADPDDNLRSRGKATYSAGSTTRQQRPTRCRPARRHSGWTAWSARPNLSSDPTELDSCHLGHRYAARQ
jgi:hypothetical protein